MGWTFLVSSSHAKDTQNPSCWANIIHLLEQKFFIVDEKLNSPLALDIKYTTSV